MKNYLDISELFDELNRTSVKIWTDKVNYVHILGVWVIVIILFGCCYFFLQNEGSYLYYNSRTAPVSDVKDAIYFSFVAATTTGFGDIIPLGYFKLLAIFEVVLGLMLLAIVTSKLVSLKQDIVLSEVYELSFTERLNGLRSALLLFRQNLDRIISKIEDGTLQKRELNNVPVYLSSFEDSLNETLSFLMKPHGRQFVKQMDPVNAELIFISILNSFEKLSEFLAALNKNRAEWNTDTITKFSKQCLAISDELFTKLSSSKLLMKQTIGSLMIRKSDIVLAVVTELGKQSMPNPKTNIIPAEVLITPQAQPDVE